MTYRSAIDDTNNNIVQISDRFHLIKGLSEILGQYINKNYSKNIVLTDNEIIESNTEDNFEEEYLKLNKKAKINYDKKNSEFLQIKAYYNMCNNYSKTAKKFNVDWRVVKEYTRIDRLPITKRNCNSSLSKYHKIIIDNIDKKMSKIYEIIKEKGYKCGYSNLKYYIQSKNLKVSVTDNNKFINRTNIVELINHKSISDLNIQKDEEYTLKKLIKKDKKIKDILEINDKFYISVFSQNIEVLKKWIMQAKMLNIPSLNTFASSVENDIEAVNNSIINLNLSNGLIEGKNCKAKMIKRIMYGRCSSKLFRAKLIQIG